MAPALQVCVQSCGCSFSEGSATPKSTQAKDRSRVRVCASLISIEGHRYHRGRREDTTLSLLKLTGLQLHLLIVQLLAGLLCPLFRLSGSTQAAGREHLHMKDNMYDIYSLNDILGLVLMCFSYSKSDVFVHK